jgi:hypothetical protein
LQRGRNSAGQTTIPALWRDKPIQTDCLWNQQGQNGQSDCGQHSLAGDPIRLPAYQGKDGSVFDAFFFKAGFARTSRSQAYSGFVSPLKESAGCSHEQEEQRQPPPAIKAGSEHDAQHSQADGQSNQANQQAFAPLDQADVWNTGIETFLVMDVRCECGVRLHH